MSINNEDKDNIPFDTNDHPIPSIIDFLDGKGPDAVGRTIATYLSASNEWFEEEHNFIQWMFPTDKPSAFNKRGPIVEAVDLCEFDEAKHAELNLIRLLTRFKIFLGQSSEWRHPGNHNLLRITRVIECLRLFFPAQPALAVSFLMDVLAMYGENVPQDTMAYWVDALGKGNA